jgi:hypothetical protein
VTWNAGADERYALRRAYVAEHWQADSDAEMADALEVSIASVISVRARLKLRRGHRKGGFAGHAANVRREAGTPDKPKGYTPEQITWAKANATEGFNNEARMVLVMHTGKRWP